MAGQQDGSLESFFAVTALRDTPHSNMSGSRRSHGHHLSHLNIPGASALNSS